jgi:hypothetical protein
MDYQVKAFNKKRLIEKNKIGMVNDFSSMKNRVQAGQKSFMLKHFSSNQPSIGLQRNNTQVVHSTTETEDFTPTGINHNTPQKVMFLKKNPAINKSLKAPESN